MKILLDHNLDRRLKNYLSQSGIETTQEKGWADVVNGELLRLAEGDGFDVLITADTNIRSQQNLTNRKIAILILRAFNNRLTTHVQMIDVLEAALLRIQSGEIVDVLHDDMAKKS